jgi:hypothetical protein
MERGDQIAVEERKRAAVAGNGEVHERRGMPGPQPAARAASGALVSLAALRITESNQSSQAGDYERPGVHSVL